MKRFLIAMMAIPTIGLHAQSLTETVINSLNTSTTIGTKSIHDPSIVYNTANKTYYIWGSHMGNAKSTNLKTWTTMHNSIWENWFVRLKEQGSSEGTSCNVRDAFNIQQVARVKNYLGEEVDMPNFDSEEYASRYAPQRYFDEYGIEHRKEWYVDGCMWAPDIIWNATMGKWCMYLSMNGENWSSMIILLTSSSAEGPWTYQGPVVMGGFNNNSYLVKSKSGIADSTVVSPTFNETDLSIALGVSDIPSRYAINKYWGNYWPNCIDPCAFFDEEGELWMAYGSWSGGIFMLKLDKETGLKDYKYNYDNNPSDYDDNGQNGVQDPYFGRKIAGGYYVSGEGPYIKYINGYYYLFMSYGDYAPRDGYEMRIFRSTSPTGPYVDAAGRSSIYTGYTLNYNNQNNEAKTWTIMNDTRGTKLMSSFTGWGEMQTQGWNSQGHNSAVVNPNTNQAFVVYHTKFNDGTSGHLVRIQQLFQNESGWLVAAPFEYNGETETLDTPNTSHYSTDDIVGDWHVIRHYYKMKQDSATIANHTPTMITLKSDGTVTSESSGYSGTWSMTSGTDYITVKLGSYTYKGVVCTGSMNGDSDGTQWTGNNHKTISFTCMDSSTDSNNSGTPLWGYKLEPRSAIAHNFTKLTLPTNTTLTSNLNVYTDMDENVTETWTSNNTDVLTNTGKFRAPDTAPSSLKVEYTGRLECGSYYWEKTYSWTYNTRLKRIAIGQADGDYLNGLAAYYDFNQVPAINLVDDSQTAKVGRSGSAGTIPTFDTDSAYRCGNVLHQYFGAQLRCSYTRMDNPLKGQNLEGATISLWVKRLDSNVWDALWSFFSGTSSSAKGKRLYLTGNTYLGFNNNDNDATWFDFNHPNDVTSENIPVGEWTLVTYVITDAGVTLYINGEARAYESYSGSTDSAEDFDYSVVLDWLSNAEYFYLGLGSFWGSAPAEFDDLLIYNRALSDEDITGLNTMANRDYNFASGSYTGINALFATPVEEDNVATAKKGIYDLNGRRLNAVPAKGIYIQDGKKKIAL